MPTEPSPATPAASAPTAEYGYFATIRASLHIAATNDRDARTRLATAITGGDALHLDGDDPDAEFVASCTLDPGIWSCSRSTASHPPTTSPSPGIQPPRRRRGDSAARRDRRPPHRHRTAGRHPLEAIPRVHVEP
ncbi:hypothetical protein [Nonomuraea sp. NPDC049400]|uniref:hypothetical protein n=1 Tax=Nonomuraea sp. NPDC049400 TaxID=3364352 RepID=UPI00378998F0